MGLTNIQYHNLHTKNVLNIKNLLDVLNNIEFTDEDDRQFKSKLNMENNHLRHRLLHIEKDIILKFIYDNEHNLNYDIMRRIAKLLNAILKCNSIDHTNRKLVKMLKNIVMGYRIY